MKSIKKLLFVMAALAAVFSFVACSDDDDDGPETVAVYKADDSGSGYTDIYTLTFYDDNSFSMYNAFDYGPEAKWSGTICTGTYTGKPAEDGDITITVEKIADEETGNLTALEDPLSKTVPVKDKKGSFPVDSHGRTVKFTRQ